MELLDFEKVSFHPDANVGYLCNNLNNTIGICIWYDTFQVQNTKWLWLVNNVVAILNSNKMLCGCFGQYASYVSRILKSVKDINFYVLCNKRRLHCANYLEKCISNTQCSISFVTYK
jgi:AraC-like DNA-binding protein